MSEVEQVETPQEWIEARKVIALKLESIREYIQLAIEDVKEYHKLDKNWYVGLEDSLNHARRVTSQYQNYDYDKRSYAIYDEETYKQDIEEEKEECTETKAQEALGHQRTQDDIKRAS